MKKTIFVLLLFILFISTNESFAQCDCSKYPHEIKPIEEFNSSDAVFVGKVIEIQKTERDNKTGNYVETVKVEVQKVWKVDSPKVVLIVNKIEGCINGFEENEEWLIYAYKKSDGTFGTGCCCSRTTSLSKAKEDLKEFEKKGEKEMEIIEESKQ